MRRTAAVGTAIVLLAAVSVGGTLMSAGAGRPGGGVLEVGPDPAQRGDTVTIGNADGSGCDGGFAEFEVMFGTDIITEQRFITPDANGDWSRTIVIADDAALGIYDVEAECLGGDSPLAPPPFRYDDRDFEVVDDVVSPAFTFVVSPGSGVAGSTVDVSGAFCSPGLGDAVVVTFTAPTPNPTWDPGDDLAFVFTVGPPDASYAGSFPVPDVAPGTYQVNGFCVGEGGSAILPPLSAPFAVLADAVTPEAPPSTPVAGSPTFTG